MLDIITATFLIVLMVAGTFSTLLGLLVLVTIFVLPKRAPMDSSNRIGHLRLVWFALKSPHKFAGLYWKEHDYVAVFPESARYQPAFPWLEKDEGDIVDGVV